MNILDMLKLVFSIILWGVIRLSSADANSCGKLTRCTIKRCFSAGFKEILELLN